MSDLIEQSMNQHHFFPDVGGFRLIDAGHTITFDWTTAEQFCKEQAVLDKQGVMTADALVFIAEKDLRYCGALVELGMAVARGIPIYVIGEAINGCIFITLPQVVRGIGDLLLSTTESKA